ncbi:MAG TPA: DUF3185 family protein [Verrucomicrobiae bacterium]|nr:DUF3185 family protein [Verrucomicrobiae bacterium]
MNKRIAFGFLFFGSVLLILGWCAYHSVDGLVAHALTGGSTDAALWFIISGCLAGITGLFGLDPGHPKQF